MLHSKWEKLGYFHLFIDINLERIGGNAMRLFKRAIALMLCLSCLGMGTASSERGSEEYNEMLSKACLRLGNNYRLKNVLDRAKAGENITVAIIGGSITEGAGAAKYDECYAKRVGVRIASTYSANGLRGVNLINAGVGGTPSTFGWIRYEQDVLNRVPENDPDGLPDIVIIEFAVNDWNEPTKHKCYESMVKSVLEQENAPAVILLFSVFKNGWNLQDELKKIGETYDLTMISVRDAAYPVMDKFWTKDEWFSDEYHPTSLGHGVMADCVMSVIDAACAAETAPSDIDLDVSPAYGLEYMGLKRIFAGRDLPEGVTLDVGGFKGDDTASYTNLPVGRVCGQNFCHYGNSTNDPLTFTATFSKLLIGWRTVNSFGTAEVYVDGVLKQKLTAPAGSWGQTEVSLLLDEGESREHTVQIRMAEGSENKQFTVTCIGIA